MQKVHFYSIIIIYLCAACVSTADAASVALRSAVTQQSDFEASLGEPFEVEIFVDPEGESLVGLSLYLSFDDQFLELIDADPTIGGLQPIEAGQLIPPNWREFDNDTHGDPGNELVGFQVDYVRLSIVNDDKVDEVGVVGRLRFRPVRATASTTIAFDSDPGASRLTAIAIVTEDDTQQQIAFSEMTSAQITIGGGPIITAPLPDITFSLGETNDSLDLDLFVTDSNNPNERLRWEALGNQNVFVEIDRESNIVVFASAPGWVGEEEITFLVTDPQRNVASDTLHVRVMSAPEIRDLPEIELRVGQDTPPINLDNFVVDLDDPDLVGLQWALTRESDRLTVNLNGSIVIIRGEAEGFDVSLAFTATDTDGNTATAPMFVTIVPNVGGPAVRDLPEVIATNDGQISVPPPSELDLDLYVVDLDFEPDRIQWTTEGNLNIIVEINPVTHSPTFRSENGWTGPEIMTFVATNPNNRQGTATMMVTLIGAGAPPRLDAIPPVTFLVDEMPTVDLKQYVFDLNSAPNRIRWETSVHEALQINIDDNGIALLQATVGTTETVTITAVDPDDNRVSTEWLITVIEPTPPQISGLPDVRLKASETRDAFNLDEFVTDALTLVEEIQWDVEGFNPANLTVEISPDHRVQFTAQPSWHGEEIVTFTATNNADLTATVGISVIGTVAPIVTFSDDIVFTNDTSHAIDLDEFVTDIDTPVEELVWTVEGSTNIGVQIDGDNRAIFSASLDFAGIEVITFTVTDADGQRDSQAVNVTVELPPIPPVIAELPDIVFHQRQTHQELDLDDFVTDADTPLDQIQWDATGQTTISVEIDSSSHIVTFQSITKEITSEDITFIAEDPEKKRASATTTVSVIEAPPPGAPTITELPDLSIQLSEVGTRQITLTLAELVTDSDTPQEELTWRVVGTDAELAVEIDPVSQIATFKPAQDFIGEKTLTFTVTDLDEQSAEDSLKFTVVDDRPKPPVITNLPSIVTFKGGKPDIVLDLDDYVSDPDTPTSALTWTSSTPLNFQLVIVPETHVVEITVNAGFLGEELVSFTVTDAGDLKNEGQVRIKVLPFDPNAKPPVLLQSPSITLEARQLRDLDLNGLVSDQDTPDELIRWEATGQERIDIDIDPNTRIATLSLAPAEQDFRGSETITLTAIDPDDKSGSTFLRVTVQNPLDRTPPTFEIFVLPNSIQPEFLTITVLASEALQTKPTVNVGGRFVQISAPIPNTRTIWTGSHVIPKNASGTVEIRAKGVDLVGLEGEGSKIFTADASLAAPAKAPSFLRVRTYPNPAIRDAIWVECQIDSPTTLTVLVYTPHGELVKAMGDGEFLPVPGRLARECQWDLSDDRQTPLANGMYFCYGVAQNGTETKTHCWKMAISR